MISGIATKPLLLLLLAIPLPSLAAPDAAALVARLKKPTPATTRYAEVRFVDVLEKPLLLAGELEHGADGLLVKRVEKPYRETTTIAAGNVTIERAGRKARRFTLARAPELAGLLESFAAVLDGDAARLARNYDVAATGGDARWSLTLTPKDRKLARKVARIVVDGANDSPRCFRVEEGDGDASVLLIDALAATVLPAKPTRENIGAICDAAP
jgi:hypothetical protein